MPVIVLAVVLSAPLALADDPVAALKRVTLAGDDADARGELDGALNGTAARDVRAAWDAALDAPRGEPARAAALAAEVAWLTFLADRVRADPTAADAHEWLGWVVQRVPWVARGGPTAALQPTARADHVNETLDAALAQRAREEVVTAFLLHHAQAPEASVHVRHAEALMTLVAPAADRLPKPLADAYRGNLSRLAVLLAETDNRKAHTLAPFMGPLAALEFDRDVERLDELGLRNADAVFAAARAATEDPALARTLDVEATRQYAIDRAGLFLMGEGDIDGVDAAYRARDNASTPPAVAAAAADVYAALRPLALLERGIVLKLESGGVQPGREHQYQVTLLRPPLAGLRDVNVTVTFNADVIAVTDVRPAPWWRDGGHTITPTTASFWVTGEQRRSATIAHVVLLATGPPKSATPLTVTHAAFTETDGDAASVHFLRHGKATVAVIDAGDDAAPPAPSAPSARVPAPSALIAFAAVAAAVTWRRADKR